MVMFVKVENNAVQKYPYTLSNLKADYPTTSFPENLTDEMLAPFGVCTVVYQSAPEFNPRTHRLQHSDMPILLDGQWTITKTVVEKTPEQIEDDNARKSIEVREKRNKLLASSDWTQVVDAPVNKEMWATYRQALRDITTQDGFPHNVTFPESP